MATIMIMNTAIPTRPIRMPIIRLGPKSLKIDMTALDYLRDPDAIYARSFESIRAETDISLLPAERAAIARAHRPCLRHARGGDGVAHLG